MKEILILGGPTMWLLAICSIVTVTVVIERLLFFRSIRENGEKMMAYVSRSMTLSEFSTEAYARFKDKKGPVGTMIREFIAFTSGNRFVRDEAIERHLAKVGREYTAKMESNLYILRVMIVIAPLFGLLGTVLGIMESFNVLSMSAGLARPELVSAGIAEALLTTAAGLIVSIVAIVFQAYFEHRIDRNVELMEKTSDILVGLNTPTQQLGERRSMTA